MMTRLHLDRVLENWPAKILSLAAAVTLFFTYQLNRLEERPLSVPLRVVTNDEYVPASQYPRTVRLVIRGDPNAIFAVLEGDLEAILDLTPYTAPGVQRVPVTIEKRGSALGIDPLEFRIEPSEVALTIEQRAVRELPIVPSFRGFLEPGYELTGFKVTPPRIEVVGPATLLSVLDDVTTEPIELTGRSEGFQLRTRVTEKDPLVSYLSSDVVEFSAEVRRAIVFKTFQDIPVEAVDLDPGLTVRGALPIGSVRVSASRTELEDFIPSAGVLQVDLAGIEKPGTYTLAVVPRFPAGFQVESWLPMVVALNVVAALGSEGQP
jgi:YbbR domain-containing protein